MEKTDKKSQLQDETACPQQEGVSEDCCDYYNVQGAQQWSPGKGPYPSDPLGDMFRHQAKFMRRFSAYMPVDLNRLVVPRDDAEMLTMQIGEMATCIAQEAAELRDWTPWKRWSEQAGNKQIIQSVMWTPYHIHEMRVEVVDIMHFLVQAAIILGMDAHTFYDVWADKARVNVARQESGSY